jgi:hypothetical protein
MKSNNRHQKHSNSNSHSPSNRSRSREKEREREREKDKAGHNRENDREKNRERNNRERERDHNNKHQQHLSHNPGNITDGKLYLTNIPINFPDHQVKEEFEHYGKVIDYSLKKKIEHSKPIQIRLYYS